jgi:hypothetical protein
MKSTAEKVLINKEVLDGVAMGFICEKPLSHSDEKIGSVWREHFNGNNSSGNFLTSRYSRNPQIICLTVSQSLLDKFLIYFLPNVK